MPKHTEQLEVFEEVKPDMVDKLSLKSTLKVMVVSV